MERELWPLLYRLIKETAKDFRQKYVQYQPWVLVVVALWASLHDRPLSWACQARHWSTTTKRPARLPSPATLSRRLESLPVGAFYKEMEERLRATGSPALVSWVDGKPLIVGGCSKDPDARYGRGTGGIAKGYKLHALRAGRAVPEAWDVTPLSANEKAVAKELLGQLGGEGQGGYLLGDGNYDASYLYDAANQAGYQLLAPCREAKNPGCGKHYQSPHRRRSLDLQRGPFGKHPFGAALYRCRTAIERSFGNAASYGGGMGPLPAWVRHLPRVRTWVWGKLLIDGIRFVKKHKLRLL